MTRDEYIKWLKQLDESLTFDGLVDGDKEVDLHEMIFNLCEMLEQQTCEDAVSREAVLGLFAQNADAVRPYSKTWEEVKALPPVNPQHTDVEIQKMQELEQAEIQKAYEIGKAEKPNKWIPVSERLPKVCEFVNCTCHSLIDDREDWVVETCYIPQPHNSPYSDWGNIPMLNWGHAEVIAWMHRDIPKPYKIESEG